MEKLIAGPFFFCIVIWFWSIVFLKDTANDKDWLADMMGSIIVWLGVGWISHLMTEAPGHFLAASVFWIGTSLGWKFWRMKKPDIRIHKLLATFFEKAYKIILFASLCVISLLLVFTQRKSMPFFLVLGGAIALFFIVALYRPVLRWLNRLSDNYKM